MQPHILLTFGTSMGRDRTIRINNANADVTDTTVNNSMNRMLASQAIVSLATGMAMYKRRAALVQTEIIPINLGA